VILKLLRNAYTHQYTGIKMRVQFMAAVILGLTLSPAPVFGCTCAAPPPEVKTASELAAWTRADAIFEGKVESVELRWKLKEAQIGDVIPTVATDLDQDGPVILVSLEILHSYRGDQRKPMRLSTGLGGGDCGFDFEVGKQYLVYAFKDEAGELSTNICTRTTRLEKSRGYSADLRGKRVAPAANKQASTTTSKLCGRVVPAHATGSIDSQVLLVRVGSKSPVPDSEAGPDSDGSFCVTDINPGKYHLLFVNRIEEALTSFVYFPGVTDLSEATAIVIPGHTPSDLVFNIPAQATFSVSGTVSNSDNPQLPAKVKVILMSASQLLLAYTADAATSGSFVFNQVLPGEYWAIVTVDASVESKWSTRKARVEVVGDITHLSLELIAN
jgi:hypothetical protein